jgi:hypothetical protein
LLIDLRYHLGSLVAVFLALGIGILIGYSLFGQEGFLDKQQQQLVDELEVRFLRLKDEREQLEANLARLAQELERDRDLVRSIQPLLIKDRLAGRNILLVVTGTAADKDCIAQVAAGLREAGANVTEVIHPRKEKGEESIVDLVAPGTDPQARQSVDGVVLIGGALAGEGTFQEIDRPLIEALFPRRILVVGAEPFGAPVSYAKDYERMSIPMVDNVDTPAGLISLVFLLSAGENSEAAAAMGVG